MGVYMQVRCANNTATPKARLVARGFKDSNLYNSFETYAPVAPLAALRWLLSVSNKYNLCLTQQDVRNAFSNSLLNKDIFIRLPPGFPHPNKLNEVLKLDKALYGLKVASKTWNRQINNVFLSLE